MGLLKFIKYMRILPKKNLEECKFVQAWYLNLNGKEDGFWNRIQYYFLKKRIAELEDKKVIFKWDTRMYSIEENKKREPSKYEGEFEDNIEEEDL